MVGIRREAKRLIVLNVAHVAVVEQPVSAADHVVAAAVDVPGEVDPRQRERRAVGQNARLRATSGDVAHAVDPLERARIEERALRRIVQRRREVAAFAAQLAVVRPESAANAVFERDVRLELPAVLRERIEIPVAEPTVRLARRRLAVACGPLIELADPSHQHVRRRVASTGRIVVAEPELPGLLILEVLLLLPALDDDAELHAVRAEQLG